MTIRLRANGNGLVQNLSGVIGCASNFGKVPSGTKIGCSQPGIGLKASRCQHDRTGFDMRNTIACLAGDPFGGAILVSEQADNRALVTNFNVCRCRSFEVLLYQSLASA